MAGQDPNANDRDGQRKAEQLGGRETTTHAERYPITVRAGPNDVLTHGEQEERQRYGGND